MDLSKILTDTQLKRVAEIMSSTQGLDRKSETLSNYLRKFHGELKAKGVDSAQLAGVIVFTKEVRRQWRIRTKERTANVRHQTSGQKGG